jgi:hypothetical protein
MHDKVTVRQQMRVPINSYCNKVKIQNVSVTLTFEGGARLFDTTHYLYVVDICAKL